MWNKIAALLIALAYTLTSTISFAQSLGNTFTGNGPPVSSVGQEASWYINSLNGQIYGPKTTGIWPSASLPNYSSSQILGTTTGAAPTAGYLGETISSTILAANAVAFSSAVAGDVTSISLTPGNWSCAGNITSKPAAGTTTSELDVAMSTTSATQPTAPTLAQTWNPAAISANAAVSYNAGPAIFRVSSNTTLYLVGWVQFAVSTMALYGTISCTRVP